MFVDAATESSETSVLAVNASDFRTNQATPVLPIHLTSRISIPINPRSPERSQYIRQHSYRWFISRLPSLIPLIHARLSDTRTCPHGKGSSYFAAATGPILHVVHHDNWACDVCLKQVSKLLLINPKVNLSFPALTLPRLITCIKLSLVNRLIIS